MHKINKWALLIPGRHQNSYKKHMCHWLREIVVVFGQDSVNFYVLSEVRLGQFSSENAALVNLPPILPDEWPAQLCVQ